MQDDVRVALKTWRESLLGVNRQSALLKFRSPKTSSLKVDSSNLDSVLSLIISGQQIELQGELETDTGQERSPQRLKTDNVLSFLRPDSEVATVSRNLMRRANAHFIDRGLHILYVSFGFLKWQDLDDTEMLSPLLLVPVNLLSQGPRSKPLLKVSEEDILLNPALSLRLKEFGIELPHIDDVSDFTISSLMENIEYKLTESRDFIEWSIELQSHISLYSFTKEAMYKDLVDNEEKVLAHPLVVALGTSDLTQQTDQFHFDPIPESNVDDEAPAEHLPLIMDADSSQRVAIAAALAGKSFVMDGPPGTGKSQTISNMIGALLHSGKTVLFVSEKIAALDVVKNRLDEAGLGSYLLELHSHKATRKEVALELLQTLENLVQVSGSNNKVSRLKVLEHRQKLNEYSRAMNQIREPLQMSLHDIIGRYSLVVDSTDAPDAELDVNTFSAEHLLEVEELLSKLARTWRPALQGSSFLWSHVNVKNSLDVQLNQAKQVLQKLKSVAQVHNRISTAFEYTKPSQFDELTTLIEHLNRENSPEIVEEWLRLKSLDDIFAIEDRLVALKKKSDEASRVVLNFTGKNWQDFPQEIEGMPQEDSLILKPSISYLTSFPLSKLKQILEIVISSEETLISLIDAATIVANTLGIEKVCVVSDFEKLIKLARILASPVKIHTEWLSKSGNEIAATTEEEAHKLFSALQISQNRASNLFNGKVLDCSLNDLNELHGRLQNGYKGLKKLSHAYRSDKSALQSLLCDPQKFKEASKNFFIATEWVRSHNAFFEKAEYFKKILGPDFKGSATDFETLQQSIQTAQKVIQLYDGEVPQSLINALRSGQDFEPTLQVVDHIESLLQQWRIYFLDKSRNKLPSELQLLPVNEAHGWLATLKQILQQQINSIQPLSEFLNHDLSQDEVSDMRSKIYTAKGSHKEYLDYLEFHKKDFGNLLLEPGVNLANIRDSLLWHDQLRNLTSGSLSDSQIAAVRIPEDHASLVKTLSEWKVAQKNILDAFSEIRRNDLVAELDDFDNGMSFIDELLEDKTGQLEWFEYNTSLTRLKELGVKPPLKFAIDQRVPADEVRTIVLKSIFRSCINYFISKDTRLSPLLSGDRDALVDEYQRIDRDLIVAATAEIIRSVNSRRPVNTNFGESAIIRREGSKQRRHRPVRELMNLSQNVIQNIKPVFMMSPLAVSQYLPSDMKFDVVIFDEASQVTPGDAVNCIYRGDSLILAGDDKQLPPTSFFERIVESEEEDTDVQDFQSILDLAKASGAITNIPLRWHYRSKHESLIAFSNYKFYEGKLITFPSSEIEGENLGVKFSKVDGIYQRGAGANNPIEARVVAQKVIDHYTKYPTLSLGVVTFSTSQADAIQFAIDEAREARRDLDEFFDTENRLDAFFIRALEQVQGDERDVIMFSVGYGPDEAGKITANFGAINRDKGWKRLNVGITRARFRVEVISSLDPGHIPPSHNENVEYFRAYLDYAKRGIQTLAIPYSSTGLDPESPFEESVIKVIRSWGYTVEPQVGAAGYRIDIGVRHPDYPGMFVLGVECDGYQYHSAPAARDRDRLRDQVLTGLGWKLHRIWGTSWYRARENEEIRLRKAIIEALNISPVDRTPQTLEIQRPGVQSSKVEASLQPVWLLDYEFSPDWRLPAWLDPGETGSYNYMFQMVESLAEHEGPIHLDWVYGRLTTWCNVGRLGNRIRDNFYIAINNADVNHDGDFLLSKTEKPIQARFSELIPRKVQHIHLEELSHAVTMLVKDTGSINKEETFHAISRLFGWGRTTDEIKERLLAAILLSVQKEEIEVQGDTLKKI